MQFFKPRSAALLLTVIALSNASISLAASAKQYQVTGKVIEVHDKMVTVDKDGEKFEIDLNDDTKVEGKLKVGEKVTIYYHMTANKVDKK